MDPIHSVTKVPALKPEVSSREGVQGKGFAETLKNFYEQVNRQILESNVQTEEFAVGKDYDLHEIIIASEKADLSFRLLTQVRNKLLEAYQEIMRMQF